MIIGPFIETVKCRVIERECVNGIRMFNSVTSSVVINADVSASF